MTVTDPAVRLAALPTDDLVALHTRLDASAVDDPAAVQAHHLVSQEMLKRGLDHGHEDDQWSRSVIVVDEAEVASVDDIDFPGDLSEPLAKALEAGGVVQVLLTVDGYVLKASPNVNTVHVDSIMGAEKPKAMLKRIVERDGKYVVMAEDTDREFGTYDTREEAQARLDQIERFAKAKEWRVDDFVTWGSSGGPARGRIERIVTEGKVNVPDSTFTLNASEEDPAVLIRVYRLTSQGFRPTDTVVGHRASSLKSIGALEKADSYKVPDAVRSAARRAVAWIEDGKAGDGFTSVGRNRARQLAEGGTVGQDTLVKMRAYFARHGKQRGDHAQLDDGEPTPWRVAWDAWGGDPGRSWVRSVLGDVEKRAVPEAITDIHVNLENRQHAIDEYLYGPMNPDEPGDYWERLGEVWGVPADEASTTRCGNCAAFNVKEEIVDAIAGNISDEGEDVAEAAGLGYCELFQFKCAAARSCSAWLTGGPLTDDEVDEEELLSTMDDDDLSDFGSYAYLADEMEKRGNPEALRDYWRGGGKGKISWGAGGDFTACVAAVGKYMTSEQAKGYCAIRHREVTGMWPGDKRNRTSKSLDGHTLYYDYLPNSLTTFSLPGGAVVTLNWPVEKHGSHDQSSHAPRKGGGSSAGGGDSVAPEGGASYGGYKLNPVDNPSATGRPDNVVAAAKRVRDKAAEAEPEITKDMIDTANANGGTMEGLDYRMKAEKSLARKIDDEKVENGGDAEVTADKMSDVVRYTMTFEEDGYTDGVSATISDLEAKGYQMRVKNYWQEGDPYQGINVAAVHPNGQKFELQFHTPGSLKAKEPIHAEYETYRESRDNRTRWKTYNRMTRMARSIAVPSGSVLSIGTTLFQGFQTAQDAGLV
jgi:hypothetical protein